MSTGGVLNRLKQPEYTGENRCIPCTVVNLAIAVGLTAIVVALLAATTTVALATSAGFVVLVVALGSIYFQGYLVPGTPALTKRYFPARVLAWFGKEAASAPLTGTNSNAEDAVDPEQALLEAGALEECEDVDDLCLTDSFRANWYDEIERVEGESVGRARLLELLDLDEAAVEYEEYGDAFAVRVDDAVVGKWESEAAYLADLGAARTLETTYDDWERLTMQSKSQLLNGLRLFIDTCPSCGGVPEFDSDTVESCCATYDVAAVHCRDCESRLFESKIPG